MVWPETKVNVSESYLPPVVQVLSYLMEEINGLAPVSESSETTQSASSSSTSEATEMASSSATTSEQTETTVETTSESSVTTEDLAESSDGHHNSSSTTEANHTVIEEDVQVNIYLTLLYHCRRFLICYRLVLLNIILIN